MAVETLGGVISITAGASLPLSLIFALVEDILFEMSLGFRELELCCRVCKG